MKRTKLLAVIMGVLMFTALVMTGCTAVKDSTKLELTETPKSTYSLVENWTLSQKSLEDAGFVFSLKLTKEGKKTETTSYVFGKTAADGEVALTFENGKFKVNGINAFELTGFDLSKAGKSTAQIKGFDATCSFDYEVKTASTATGFARGSGKEGDPYVIETAEQFMLLDSAVKPELYTETTYVKLNADIDLGGAVAKVGFEGKKVIIGEVENLILDGNGYKIYNITAAANYLIGRSTTAVEFRNLSFYVNFQNLGFFYEADGGIKFIGVNAFGNKTDAGSNTGVYLTYCQNKGEFTRCRNYCNVESTDSYVSAFLGYPYSSKSIIAFTDCVNYGNVSGQAASAFICNDSNIATATFTNCKNVGSIISLTASNVISATEFVDSKFTADNLEVKKYYSQFKRYRTIKIDNATYKNTLNRLSLIEFGTESTQNNYFEECGFNAEGKIVVKLKADKADKVTKIVIKANYLPGYNYGGEYGTNRQYLKEEFTDITAGAITATKVFNYKVKVLENLPDGVNAATNLFDTWGVVDGSYVIAVNQPIENDWYLVKDSTGAALEPGFTFSTSFSVFVFENNALVAGKTWTNK